MDETRCASAVTNPCENPVLGHLPESRETLVQAIDLRCALRDETRGPQGRAALAVPQRLPGRWGVDGSLRRVVLQHLEADFDGHLILRNPALVDEPPQLGDLKPA